MKINLLAPASGTRLVAEGRVVRNGRRLLVVASEVYAEGDAARRHVATMLGTIDRPDRASLRLFNPESFATHTHSIWIPYGFHVARILVNL